MADPDLRALCQALDNAAAEFTECILRGHGASDANDALNAACAALAAALDGLPHGTSADQRVRCDRPRSPSRPPWLPAVRSWMAAGLRGVA